MSTDDPAHDFDEDTDDDSVSFAACQSWPEDETTLRRVARMLPTGGHRTVAPTQPPPVRVASGTQPPSLPRLAHPRLLRRRAAS